ncbi:MAG: AAA family ATPase [Armatimonadetes bacterium]|nr:AAA family ATPase [Armatimonadota bacterium]
MDPIQEIEVLIRAQYPVLYLVSWEERRVESALSGICKSLGRNLHVWSLTKGLIPELPGSRSSLSPELAVLTQILEAPDKTVFLLKDYHPFLKDLRVIRLLRDLAESLRGKSVTLCLLAPQLVLPVEVEKDITVLEFPLPNKAEIEAKLNDVIASMSGNDKVDVTLAAEDRERMIKAAQGLTLDEIESCFARSLVEHKKFDLSVVIEEKKQIIRKSGILEFYPANNKLEDVGGQELLKEWLQKRGTALTDKAREFGIPPPKGLLLLGVQGCGKSLVAKAVGASWNLPLLKLDVGRIFGSLVGQSEENMRKAIRVAEGVAPCILWADELEKGFGGMGGGGDNGTGQRVLATFLSWMQEKTKPVVIIATANDVSKLPPELLRKGRFDDIFFVDLPDAKERADIFAIHLKKRARDPKNYDLPRLAKAADGFSGAEIEQVVVGALFSAFGAGRELTNDDLEAEAKAQVPLSRTMAEEIDELRNWASIRARPSSKRDD